MEIKFMFKHQKIPDLVRKKMCLMTVVHRIKNKKINPKINNKQNQMQEQTI